MEGKRDPIRRRDSDLLPPPSLCPEPLTDFNSSTPPRTLTPVNHLEYQRLKLRILSKVHVSPSGCWEWTGALTGKSGYASMKLGGRSGRTYNVHKWLWEHNNGPTPPGLELDHLCHTRSCINPRHLEPVTRSENIVRGWAHRRRTHCKRGHEFTPENTYIPPSGGRQCRSCRRQAKSLYRQRKKGHPQPTLD